MYHTRQLKNGIRIIHKQVDSDVAHCGLVINTGSRDEMEKEHGMAHFVEHMLFKGTKKRKAFHVLSRLEDIGGELDAYTTKEETCISASFLAEFYERTIELINDVIFSSTYPDKEIKKEVEIIIDEINSYKDTPSDMIYDDFEDIIFENHPLGRNILGSKKTISKFNKEKISNFISANYNTDEMVFCSIGKIKIDKLIYLCEKYFGQQNDNLRQNSRQAFKTYIPRQIRKKKNTHQAHCIIGTPAYSYFSDKKNILMIISNLLAGPGMNSRLNMLLREKHGISYSIESLYTPFYDTGNFSIYFGTDKDKVDKSLGLIYKELERLRNVKLGPIQLSKTKKQVYGQLAISNEIHSHQLLSMGKSYMLYDKVSSLKELYQEIDKVAVEDILNVANEIFVKDNFSELVYY